MKLQDITALPAKEAKQYFDETETKSNMFQAICYTPERLVRSQEYRILTPSPRYLSIRQSRMTGETEDHRNTSFRSQRRLNYLIDSKQLGGYFSVYRIASYTFDILRIVQTCFETSLAVS